MLGLLIASLDDDDDDDDNDCNSGYILFLLKALVLVWFCFVVQFCINQIKTNGFTKNEIYS